MGHFINTSINNSATIVAVAASEIKDGAHKAVSFDANGQAVIAGVGSVPIGVLIGSTEPVVGKGGDLSVQVKDIGYIIAGSNIAAGDPVTTDANGAGIKASSGKFVLGFALASGTTGELVQIQVTKSGYMA